MPTGFKSKLTAAGSIAQTGLEPAGVFAAKQILKRKGFFWSIFLFQLVVSHSLKLGKIGTTLNNDDHDDYDDNHIRINLRSGPIL